MKQSVIGVCIVAALALVALVAGCAQKPDTQLTPYIKTEEPTAITTQEPILTPPETSPPTDPLVTESDISEYEAWFTTASEWTEVADVGDYFYAEQAELQDGGTATVFLYCGVYSNTVFAYNGKDAEVVAAPCTAFLQAYLGRNLTDNELSELREVLRDAVGNPEGIYLRTVAETGVSVYITKTETGLEIVCR